MRRARRAAAGELRLAGVVVAGLLALALGACEERAAGPAIPVIPDGHPCPELALAPAEAALWHGEEVVPLALRLPTPPGLAVRVTQGNDGAHSHFGAERFAWDFGVPLATPVHAAAGGVVVWVTDDRVRFGPGEEFREEANFVVLDHGAGLFTNYVHLAAGSAAVAPGDVVAAGEVLAVTGMSGQMTGPHLHFQVENVWSESLPARFADAAGCGLLPRAGDEVVAWEAPLASSDRLSAMPAETFAEDGVVALAGLPARLFERGERPRLSGQVGHADASEVWFLLLPAAGGEALFAQRFAVSDGAFTGRLDVARVARGQYGVALVAGGGVAVSVPRSVRAALVD